MKSCLGTAKCYFHNESSETLCVLVFNRWGNLVSNFDRKIIPSGGMMRLDSAPKYMGISFGIVRPGLGQDAKKELFIQMFYPDYDSHICIIDNNNQLNSDFLLGFRCDKGCKHKGLRPYTIRSQFVYYGILAAANSKRNNIINTTVINQSIDTIKIVRNVQGWIRNYERVYLTLASSEVMSNAQTFPCPDQCFLVTRNHRQFIKKGRTYTVTSAGEIIESKKVDNNPPTLMQAEAVIIENEAGTHSPIQKHQTTSFGNDNKQSEIEFTSPVKNVEGSGTPSSSSSSKQPKQYIHMDCKSFFNKSISSRKLVIHNNTGIILKLTYRQNLDKNTINQLGVRVAGPGGTGVEFNVQRDRLMDELPTSEIFLVTKPATTLKFKKNIVFTIEDQDKQWCAVTNHYLEHSTDIKLNKAENS